MNQFRKFCSIALLIAMSCTTLYPAVEQNKKQERISTLQKEINLFRDAVKAAKKCIGKKECSKEERKAMYRATKHGLIIIALLGAVAYGMYRWHKPPIRGQVSTSSHQDEALYQKRAALDQNEKLQNAFNTIRKKLPTIEDDEIVTKRLSELKQHITNEKWSQALDAIGFTQNQIMLFLESHFSMDKRRLNRWLRRQQIHLPRETFY